MHLSCVVLELFSKNRYIWTGSDRIAKNLAKNRFFEDNSRTTQDKCIECIFEISVDWYIIQHILKILRLGGGQITKIQNSKSRQKKSLCVLCPGAQICAFPTQNSKKSANMKHPTGHMWGSGGLKISIFAERKSAITNSRRRRLLNQRKSLLKIRNLVRQMLE